MKTLSILPLILLSACASKPQVVHMPKSVPGTVLPTERMESVRYGENIKGYPVGRYIDPHDNLAMHERHTVYRVETTAKWNLHPNVPVAVPLGPPLQIIDPAKRDAPVSAEIIAEINRQKAATQALLQQGTRLDQTLSQISGAFQVTKQLGEQNQQLKQELSTAQKRLDLLEQELRKKQAEAPFDPKEKEQW
jgi:hypothetical protein